MGERRVRYGWQAAWIALAIASVSAADDGNVYDNQVEMTATLFAADPDRFDDVCTRLEGELKRAEGTATCRRGLSILAIGHDADTVRWAMIAYPVSDEDIAGLRKAARARFGQPDSAKNRELIWYLPKGVVASAGYDDEFSTFSLVQTKPR